MMKLFWRDFKWFILAIGLILTSSGFMLVNECAGSYEVTSEPYTASYIYCAAWARVGGQNNCTLWLSGTERRVNTKVHGYFFETTSYRVVN